MRNDFLSHYVQRMWRELVVVIEQHYIVTLGQCERVVRGCGDVAVLLPEGDADARIGASGGVEYAADRRARGSVVDDAELPIRVELFLHRLDGPPEPLFLRVVHGHQD